MKLSFEDQVIQDTHTEVAALSDRQVLEILHNTFDDPSPISGEDASRADAWMAGRRADLKKHLYNIYMNGIPNLDYDLCSCGSLLELCPDSYEHMTHGY